MAKPNPPKNHPKPDSPVENIPTDPGKEMSENVLVKAGNANEPPAKPAANPTLPTAGKKEPILNRNKKGATGPAKATSLMPSQHKLEHLKAAVAAAGSVDNLLLILQHVDEAGGRQEVAESVEAYRALKLALE